MVFTKGDIHHPVKAVLNRPVMLGGLQQPGCIGRRTADPEGGFLGDMLADTPVALASHNAVQVCPTVIMADMLKRQRVRQVAEAFLQTERALVVRGALLFALLSPFCHFEAITLELLHPFCHNGLPLAHNPEARHRHMLESAYVGL
jgi:hypothetical protein